MTIVVEYCKIILDNRRVYSGGDMVKQVIVTADKVRKRKRYATIVKIALLSLLLLLAVFYFILQIIYNEGRFTISLDSNKTLESGIAIYESLNDPQPKRKLEADAISFMDNISEKWLPENVNTEADGSHNGENYIAYSFYVENQGKETLHYWYEIIVEDVIKNVDEAIRIAIYQNDKKEVFAKENSLSFLSGKIGDFVMNVILSNSFVISHKYLTRLKACFVLHHMTRFLITYQNLIRYIPIHTRNM